jgi:aminopeptidase N
MLLATVCVLAACGKTDEIETTPYDPAHDYFSFANTSDFVTRHIELDLVVDFEAEQLRGSVVLFLRSLNDDAAQIILDTRDLTISSVTVSGKSGDATPADYRFGDEDAVKGTPLIIDVPTSLNRGAEFRVRIEYETSPGASALQWLPPKLTAGGQHPMMFSQSQAIHARSWVPLQDTPAVRITYDAKIHTPEELLAVMSADNDPLTPRRGEYSFNMPQPIPSYLLALAVGNLYFAPLGEDTGVYTEPELLDASVYEFGQTQDMLEIAEEQFGPYQWGRYDLLVLPPSFPYGGMENPRLSFLTPSLLAGDRSLVSVVAHELAHSWSGNLVTNRTWRDSWLNEGVTSYLEARLMEVIYDVDRVDEERVLGYEELLLNFERVPVERQGLAPRFDSGDPDDFQGTIHYHKGQLFLQYLEECFGREVFDPFLLQYFSDYEFETITTEEFLDYLDEKLLLAIPGVVSRDQVKQWLYEPGLPDDAPVPTSRTLERVVELAAAWSDGEITIDAVPTSEWSPQAMVHFLNNLPADLELDRLVELDDALRLSDTRNAEIGRTWFIQVATRRHEAAYAKLELHLNRYGRTRLVKPVYRALATNGHDFERAKSMFDSARSSYHPLTVDAVLRVFAKAENP